MADFVASPATRAYAAQKGVDLSALAAEIGRTNLAREDIDRKLSGAMPLNTSDLWAVDHRRWGPVRQEPLSKMMQVGSANLSAAQRFIPAVTHHDEAGMDAVEALRAELKADAAEKGVKLTALAFHVLALAACLKAFPRFNASLTPDGTALVLKDYVHIGIAVDTPAGLMVPVIRDVDRKGLFAVATEISDLAERAQARKIRAEEMGGASISISSLGGIGGSAFTPIVNPPEVAILGITRAQIRPHWDGEAFLPRLTVPLDLSYDHRAINGADAARFLSHHVRLIADPRRLLL
ncbi:2-oxo acid dehydrogenase subunit E2 [Shinella sp.]|uniref:2-oxo acid dehydrogenase subunit E2 n=1 Tax=Shinella sp. TaxID=1870904 RepID=UPI003F70C950